MRQKCITLEPYTVTTRYKLGVTDTVQIQEQNTPEYTNQLQLVRSVTDTIFNKRLQSLVTGFGQPDQTE